MRQSPGQEGARISVPYHITINTALPAITPLRRALGSPPSNIRARPPGLGQHPSTNTARRTTVTATTTGSTIRTTALPPASLRYHDTHINTTTKAPM